MKKKPQIVMPVFDPQADIEKRIGGADDFKYLSICSGIEAATVAWHPLGWKPVAFSEIDKFPRTLLQYHYPDVPLHGDFTTIKENEYGPINLLVGGTPCQDFSVAGLRKGIAGERGNLTLEFVRLAQRYRPEWVLWENVPGVLSQDGVRAFGAFLGGLAECGYGFAYRVLDAQYFGVPQRRRRVFVVGYLGDWRPAAAVLFERESLLRNLTPRRQTGEGIAPTLSARTKGGGGLGTDFDLDGGLIPELSPALKARDYKGPSSDGAGDGAPLIPVAFDSKASGTRGIPAGDVAPTLRAMQGKRANAGGQIAVAFAQNQRDEVRQMDVVGALSAQAGMKQQTYVAIPIQEVGKRTGKSTNHSQNGVGIGADGDPMFTLQASAQHAVAAFKPGQSAKARTLGYDEEVSPSIEAGGGGNSMPALLQNMVVRRLTPLECERLQGLPDGYTLIPIGKGKLAADGPRYKALGNTIAVPPLRWLGERINMVNSLIRK